MILKINNVTISGADTAQGANFTTQVVPVLNDNRQEYKRLEQWTITGRIHPDQSATTDAQRQASIVAKAAAIEAAILPSDQNEVVLLQDDGSAADSISDANVIQDVSFGGSQRGENALFREYTLTIERQYNGRDTNFASYRETVTYFGGGPRSVIQELRSGLPVEYVVSQATPYHAVQTGAAVHRISPYFQNPYWPGRIITPEQYQRTPETRTADGYGSSWSYQFSSPAPFSYVSPVRPA